MRLANHIKKYYFSLFFLFSSFSREKLSYQKDFDIIQCVFKLCMLCLNLNCLYAFLLWKNLKIRPQHLKMVFFATFSTFSVSH